MNMENDRAYDDFDWAGLESAAVEHILRAVRQVRQGHAAERMYGAIVHEFYGDGTQVSWPLVSIGTDESLARVVEGYRQKHPGQGWDWSGMLRWSGSDLEYVVEAGDVEKSWARSLQEYATRQPDAAWFDVYNRFLRSFPSAVRHADALLRAAGEVDEDFIAVAMDEEGTLVPLSVSRSVLHAHFPDHLCETMPEDPPLN